MAEGPLFLGNWTNIVLDGAEQSGPVEFPERIEGTMPAEVQLGTIQEGVLDVDRDEAEGFLWAPWITKRADRHRDAWRNLADTALHPVVRERAEAKCADLGIVTQKATKEHMAKHAHRLKAAFEGNFPEVVGAFAGMGAVPADTEDTE